MIGKLLGNRYEILEQLGEGGMSVVYKARDNFLNRLVTIKILRSEFVSDFDFVRRFRREAQAVARLSHPNIVNIHDVGQENETQYLVMEYVDGDNLKNIIINNQLLDLNRITNFIDQICDALQHAHENNIVHRDVKPQNILITRDERVKLTDFGIAYEATTGTISNTETVLGSVHYISPEQAKGETPGAQSDIYSLGVVLYEMLTAQLPFKGDTPVAVALKHVQEEPPLPSIINPRVPHQLERVVMKAMEKDPARRYQTAKEFSADLQQVVNGLNVERNTVDDFATQVLPISALPTQEEKETKPSNHPRQKPDMKKVGIIATLLVLSLLAGVLLAFFRYINVPEVTVPDVVGKTVEVASDELKRHGLDVKVNEVYDEAKEGIVISQKPEANSKVKRGRVVELTVSLGPELQQLPDVRGKPVSDAQVILQNAGFSYTIEEIFSDNYEAGVVVEQEPAPGEHSKSTKVLLKVSKGPQLKSVKMPNLVGLKLSEARDEVAKLNLVLDEPIQSQRSEDYMSGYVIHQTPNVGADISEGSGVTFVISDGPGPAKRTTQIKVEIPNDGQNHELRIALVDARGKNDSYYVDRHASGEVVVKTVEFYGRAAVRIYIDGELNEEVSL